MDENALRRLAGLPTLKESVLQEKKKQLSDVKAKVEVPEGTFTKKAGAIVKTLLKLHDGDVGKAIKALSFYINRAGKDVANKDQLDAAKEQLKAKNLKESFEFMRKIAGLPVLEKKEKAEEEPADDEGAAAEGEASEEEEETVPSIIKKIAKKAEGKTGEDLEVLLQKVYDAGFKDGQTEAAEGESEEVKEAAIPISDELAAKKIAAKVQGTSNLKMSSLETLVRKYLTMVNKAETDVKHLTALVAAELQDKGLMD